MVPPALMGEAIFQTMRETRRTQETHIKIPKGFGTWPEGADRDNAGKVIGIVMGRREGKWWPETDSNRRRQPFQGCALPTELSGRQS